MPSTDFYNDPQAPEDDYESLEVQDQRARDAAAFDGLPTHRPQPRGAERADDDNDKTPELPDYTDYEVASAFVAQCGPDLYWVAEHAMWLRWDDGKRPGAKAVNGCWVLSEHAGLKAFMKWAVAQESRERVLLEAARATGSDKGELARRDERVTLASRLKNTGKAKSVLEQVKGELELSASRLDANRELLAFQNGTMDLATQTLRPALREDLGTKVVDLEYNPEATCSEWLEYLDHATGGDVELQRYLQKVAGYCLTGRVTDKSFFILYGPPHSGKSAFLEALRMVLGHDYARTAHGDLLLEKKGGTMGSSADYALAHLHGARLVDTSEQDVHAKLSVSLVQRLTGGDQIMARQPYGKPFSYTPQFKMFIATNDLPRISADQQAMWERVRTIPFLYAATPEMLALANLPGQSLAERLGRERQGILAWMVEGVRLFLSEGLAPPACVVDSRSTYRSDQDVLAQWIDDCVVTRDGDATGSTLEECFQSFLEWQQRQNLKFLTYTARSFTKALRERHSFQDANSKKNGRRFAGRYVIGSATFARAGVQVPDPDASAPAQSPKENPFF